MQSVETAEEPRALWGVGSLFVLVVCLYHSR